LKRVLELYWLICIASCNSVQKKAEKPNFDEPTLKEFVQKSSTQNTIITIRLLDSIISSSSNDSSVFYKTVNCLTYFYSDPNSPFRNEEIYDRILKAKRDSRWCTISDRQDVASKLRLLHQNDVGNLANDFVYCTPDGKRGKMYNMEADHLLLFFYNPECSACKEITSALKNNLTIAEAINNRKLKMFCVYTDTDLSTWYRHIHEFPLQWIQGRDDNEYLYKNSVYDLRAIPSLYLLDRKKKVILKDCTSIDEIEQHLQ